MPNNSIIDGLREVLTGGYPSATEILRKNHKHRPTVIKAVKAWKREVWYPARAGDHEARFKAIEELVVRLAKDFYDKPVKVVWKPDAVNSSSFYTPKNETITICGEPSIVTALHELAHHLFGESEDKACKWSVHLFRKTFPKAFGELHFSGHMLTRKD